MKIDSQPRSRGWPGALRAGALALALAVGGCATAPKTAGPVTLKISGDPGVTVQVISSLPNVPPQTASVPAELQFHGANYELRCVHGTQPGRLKIIAARGGLEISTGDTTQPGQVVVFKIRTDEIAAGAGVPAK